MAFTANNVAKYRLGPPSSIVLDLNSSSPIDLGSTMGGVTFTYKQTHFKAIADQVIGPVADWRTEESGTIELSVPEISVPRLLTAFGYPTTQYTTVLSSAAISAVSAGTQSVVGTTGAVAYAYSLFAYNSNGDGIPVACTPAISTGNTQLTSANYNLIAFPALPAGAVGFGVLRTTGGAATTVGSASNGYALPIFGATPTTLTVASTTGFATSGTATVVTTTGIQTFSYSGVTGTTFTGCAGGTGVMLTGGVVSQYGIGLVARVTQQSGLPVSYSDTGTATTVAYANSAAQPAAPNTDTATIGGTITTPVHQLDLIIPKNVVNSTLNWRWTFWSVVSDGEIMVDWKRDKNSEFKISFGLLMNLAQPIGQNLFRCVEEY